MKKWIKRLITYVFLPMLTLIFLICIVFTGYRAWVQNAIKERRTITEANGIERFEAVPIGGVKQWIQIRGRDKANPILLYLHGGPGAGYLILSPTFQDDWEKHFTVVQWEQRGTGKSFDENTPATPLTKELMISDTLEMVQTLRKRFNREKIFILGHSWGSVLGMHAVKRHPEWFHAYIGVGQVADMQEGEKISYNYTLQVAKERKNETAMQQLLALAPYPSDNMVRKLIKQREWLMKFNGSYYSETSVVPFLKAVISFPDYSISDIGNYFKGMFFSLDALWEPFMASNTTSLGSRFEVPVFFFAGRHDYQVPATLAYDYFQQIEAPEKGFVWFETSGHNPMIEEPEKFTEALVTRVLPMAQKDL